MKKSLILLSLAIVFTLAAANPEKIAELKAGKIDTAQASWWGFDAEDSTQFLQDAINSGAKKLIVDYTGQDWIIGRTILLASNQELVFADKVVVRAKKDQFKRIGDMLFKGVGISNVVIRGEGNAALVMNKADYLDKTKYLPAEWRHVISLHGANDLVIRDITLKSSGGDGIYVGAGSPDPYCKNVLIENVVSDDNNRLGIAVIAAENLLIKNCKFINSTPSSPAGGIDFEPNRAAERLVNCRVEDCFFEGNKGAGISISPNHLNETSEPVSITFKNCKSNNNGLGLFLYPSRRSELPPVKGTVEFIDCDFSGNDNLFQDPIADTIKFTFRNCTFSAGKNDTTPFLIICKEAAGRKIGGLHFENCTVKLPHDRIAPMELNYLGAGLVSDEIGGQLTVQAGAKSYPFDFAAFLKERQQYFDMINRLKSRTAVDLASLKLPAAAVPRDPANNLLYTRGVMTYIQYAKAGDNITVDANCITGGYPGGIDLTLAAPDGSEIRKIQVPLGGHAPVTFTATQTGYYTLKGGNVQRLDITSAHPGGAYLIDKEFQVLLPLGGKAYFEVPPGVGEFHVGISSSSGVDAMLLDTTGKAVDQKNGIRSMIILTGKRQDTSKSEIWAVQFDRAVWEVNLRLYEPLLPIFSNNPASLPLQGDPAQAVYPAGIENLLKNGGFENHRNNFPLYWQRLGNTEDKVEVATDSPAEGKSYLKVAIGKPLLTLMSPSNIEAKPGDKLLFSAKVRGKGKFNFEASQYDADKRWIRPNSGSPAKTVDSAEWQTVTYEYTVPDLGVASFRFSLIVHVESTLDFDGCEVKRI